MARTSLALMGVTVVNSAMGYLFWTLAARRFSATDVGVASVILSTAIMLAIVADLGTRTIAMQELPRARTPRDWSRWVTTLLLTVFFSAFVTGAVGLLLLTHVSDSMKVLAGSVWPVVFVVLTVGTAVFNLLDGISTAERSPGSLLWRNSFNAVAKVLVLLGIAVFASTSWRAIVLCSTVCVVVSVSLGVTHAFARLQPGARPSARGSLRTVRSMRGSVVGHHVLNLGGQLPMYIMPLEVVAQLGPRDNAYMWLTWQVGGAFLLVSPAVSSALFVQGRWSPEEMGVAVRRAARIIAALLVPLAVVMIGFGKFVLGIFGPDYAREGYLLLVALAVSAFPDAYTNIQIAILRAQGRLRAAAALNISMALLAVVAVWFLLPVVGIVGVGLGWLFAQSCGSVWCLVNRWRARSRDAVSLDPVASPSR